jgi:5-methylcytosine-specific restriction protein A
MPAVTGAGGLALFLGRATRFFTPAQKLAIALRDGGCARCGVPVARCDVHHIKFWSLGGPTDIDNGVLLCSGCHHRLHDFGWEIEVIAGEVWFIPPASVDPRRERIPACATRSPTPTG